MNEYIKTIVMVVGGWVFAAITVGVVWHALTYNKED